MLKLHLPAIDDIPAVELHLEHSLVSVSAWEAKYEKPFFSKNDKTAEEALDYIRFMTVNGVEVAHLDTRLSIQDFTDIRNYIDSKQTATFFNEVRQGPPSREIVTSELVYYWMISLQIPFECQYWHLNRLMTLIKVCGIKQSKPQKTNAASRAQQMRELNEQRLRQLGTTG